MGAYSYCVCGKGQKSPTAIELLYGRNCSCGEEEDFTLSEKVDFLFNNLIDKEKQNAKG